MEVILPVYSLGGRSVVVVRQAGWLAGWLAGWQMIFLQFAKFLKFAIFNSKLLYTMDL